MLLLRNFKGMIPIPTALNLGQLNVGVFITSTNIENRNHGRKDGSVHVHIKLDRAHNISVFSALGAGNHKFGCTLRATHMPAYTVKYARHAERSCSTRRRKME